MAIERPPAPPAHRALHRELSANLVGFCRLLREGGLGMGAGEVRDALCALDRLDLGDPELFRLGLRTTLAKSGCEQEVFDRHFDSYWQVWEGASELNSPRSESRPAQEPRSSQTFVGDWLKKRRGFQESTERAGYSPFEVLTRRDFASFGAGEVRELTRLIARLARVLATRFCRRRRPRRGSLDLRATLRRILRSGGEVVELRFCRRRRKRLKLVLLCDVSRSMDLYSRFLIQFLYAFQSACGRLETFVFGTALHHITPALKSGDLEAALARLAREVPDWSGGTRIGAALHTFLAEHAAGLLDRRSVVLVVSDGWDTGELELLQRSMETLHRRAHYLIWLNPLMGQPGYEPSCRGMRAALPFVDLLAPAHNLESLRRLVRRLEKVQRRLQPRAPRKAFGRFP